MLPHNSLNCIQTEAAALSHSLGGEKWFKDMRLDLRWNPGTVVPDLDHHTSGVAICAYPKFPPAVDGVNRVIDDVGPNLIQLTAERIHQKRTGW